MYFECNDPVSSLARSIAYARAEIIRKIKEIEHQIEIDAYSGIDNAGSLGRLNGLKEALDTLNSYCTVVED